MPRTAKIRFLSPAQVGKQPPKPPVEQFPAPVLRGMIRGLLHHFLGPQMRRRLVKDVSVESSETVLMQLAVASTRLYIASKKEPSRDAGVIKMLTEEIPRQFENLRHPTAYVLNKDSDLILEELQPYKNIADHASRERWLKRELPGLLGSLKKCRTTSPASSRQCTDLPDAATLSSWACSANVGQLRNEIIGYFHGLTATNVRSILSQKLKS